tara:strand:- start:1108 stop:1344 length:237 start_codon:yes stop_codon:yes gene_type:complete
MVGSSLIDKSTGGAKAMFSSCLVLIDLEGCSDIFDERCYANDGENDEGNELEWLFGSRDIMIVFWCRFSGENASWGRQ